MTDIHLNIITNQNKKGNLNDNEMKGTTGIDIDRINQGIRKNFEYDFQEMNSRKNNIGNQNSNDLNENQGSNNSNDSDDNSGDGNSMIQKSPLLELDSPTKEFECNFPDFYSIDNIGFLYNRKILNLLKKNSIKEIIKQNDNEEHEAFNNDYSFSKLDKNINDNILINLFLEKGIHKITSNMEFELGTLLYQHKHEVYKGKYHPLNKDQCDVFIKKIYIRNKEELDIAINEFLILFKLIFIKDPKTNLQMNPYINKLLHFYYDENERCFFTFYEYEDITLMKEIISIENSTETEKTINRQKLYLVHKLLHLLVMLHSNKIIHRDIRIYLFYFSPKKDDENDLKGGLKTFDFTSAYMFPDNIDLSKIDELTNKINNDYFF